MVFLRLFSFGTLLVNAIEDNLHFGNSFSLEDIVTSFNPITLVQTWFAEIRSKTESQQPKTEFAPTSPKISPNIPPKADDQQKLKQLESQNQIPPSSEQISDEDKKDLKTLHKLERAVFMARTPRQREQYYEKAQEIFSSLYKRLPDEHFFKGEKRDVLQDKLKTGNHVEKMQAALWLVHPRYGKMLGSFGTSGIDGTRNYFTAKAVEKFRNDYNAGLIYDLPKPTKHLAKGKETEAFLIAAGQISTKRLEGADKLNKAIEICERTRANFFSANQDIVGDATWAYNFAGMDLDKQHLEQEASVLRNMIEDPKQKLSTRSAAMLAYGYLNNVLSEKDLESGYAIANRYLADPNFKFDASSLKASMAQYLSSYRGTQRNEEETALVDRAFNKPMPGEQLKNLNPTTRQQYQEAFSKLKAASWYLGQVKGDSYYTQKADEVFEEAKKNYLEICSTLNISAFVRRDTLGYFVDKVMANLPAIAA